MPKRKNLAKNQLAVVKRVSPPGAEEGKQKLAAIANMRLGGSMAEAARNAGVSRSTLYRWISSEPEFQAAYNSWHEETKECTRASLVAMYDVAVDNVRKGLERGDVGLSMKLLKGSGALEPEEKRRMTDAEQIKRRGEFDEKKRRVDIETDELHMQAFLSTAKQLAGVDEARSGDGEEMPPGEEREFVEELSSKHGKVKKVMTKRTATTGFTMLSRPVDELIRAMKASGALTEDGLLKRKPWEVEGEGG